MFLILRTQIVEKSLLENSRCNLSTYFGGVLKTHFGELKKRFLATAPIHIVWYIRNIYDCLEVSVFSFVILSTFVFFVFDSKAISTQISINLLDCNRLHIILLSYILTWSLFWGPKSRERLTGNIPP
jgi:hypothetical protein